MEDRGYELKYDHNFAMRRESDRGQRPLSLFRPSLPYADRFSKEKSKEEKEDELMRTRLALRKIGEEHGGDLTVFSFWPDVAMIKEVGWPLQIGDILCLHDGQIKSRICMAQGRQNTNYGINLYACHPFFLQGIATMTNGENTAFVPIRDWLLGKDFPAIWAIRVIPRCSPIFFTIP